MKVKTIIVSLLFAFLCLSLEAKTDHDEMPIIAYFGVPEQDTNTEAFQTLRDCGFSVSLFDYSSLPALLKACKTAEKVGVKVLGTCPELVKSPDKVARALKAEPGFFGYFLQDEPNAPEIAQRQKEMERLKAIDDKHTFYINLFPCYNSEWVKSSMKTENYQEYLRTASKTSCQQISFDFYPVTANGIRTSWYNNLEMIRKESLTSGKPFWAFVLSTPHDVPFDKGNYYPKPTLASLRLQVYSNLAYGAQAIQYFTYMTPDANNSYHYHDGPIGINGKKTKTYALVQQMNKELKSVSKLFYGAKVLSVHHLLNVPDGTIRLSGTPANIRSLKVVGYKGALVSQIEKNGNLYLAIVNKDHQRNMTVQIQCSNNIPRHLSKTLQEKEIKSVYTVEAGDMLLFRLK